MFIHKMDFITIVRYLEIPINQRNINAGANFIKKVILNNAN